MKEEEFLNKFGKNKLKSKKCHDCEGTGYSSEMIKDLCGKCAGTGRDTSTEFWAENCIKCNGAKYFLRYIRTNKKCRDCHGSGIIYY